MSEVYVDPPPFNLQASFDDSDPKTPLIFLLSAGSDPMVNLYAFAAEHDMTDKYALECNNDFTILQSLIFLCSH